MSEVVRHFLRFLPRHRAGTAEQLAYYRGYAAALDATSAAELTSPGRQEWFDDLRDSVARCVTVFEEQAAMPSTAR